MTIYSDEQIKKALEACKDEVVTVEVDDQGRPNLEPVHELIRAHIPRPEE
jgi:hypothetical protein